MRDYQPTRNNPYYLPKTLYKRVLSTVRDYDRMRREYLELLHSSGRPADGQPRGNEPGNPTADRVQRLDKLWGELHAIEQALMVVPEEYRMAVLDKVRYDRWPTDKPVGKNLPGYWKSRFLFRVAKNLKLL